MKRGFSEGRGRWQEWERENWEMTNGVVTVFVDNLHPQTDQNSLANLLSKWCSLKDVFIPNKRRIGRRDHFGFVRVDNLIIAKRLNESCDDIILFRRRLKLKLATYGRERETAHNTNQRIEIKGHQVRETITVQKRADDLIREDEVDGEVDVLLEEGALEWLRRCAVGKLKVPREMEDMMKWRMEFTSTDRAENGSVWAQNRTEPKFKQTF